MNTKKKVTITGVLMAGTALLVWRRSGKQRALLADWKKRKIEDVYYASRDERDIAWG